MLGGEVQCGSQNSIPQAVREEEERRGGEVRAHQLLLSAVSPVFRDLFSGESRVGAVLVEDTTVEAFTTMVDFIYQPPSTDQFAVYQSFTKDITNPETLFDILNISERYKITELSKLARDALSSLPITTKNLRPMVSIKNLTNSKDFSKMLAKKCEASLNNLPLTADNLLFISAHSKDLPLSTELSEYMEAKAPQLATLQQAAALILETRGNNPGLELAVVADLLEAVEGGGWAVAYSLPGEHSYSSCNLLATLPSLASQWRLTLAFRPGGVGPGLGRPGEAWGTSLYLLGGGVPSILSIYLTSQASARIQVNFTTNGASQAKHFPKHQPEEGVWTDVEVRQEVQEGEVQGCLFTVSIGGVEVHREVNKEAREVPGVAVYTSGYPGTRGEGTLRDLAIYTRH